MVRDSILVNGFYGWHDALRAEPFTHNFQAGSSHPFSLACSREQQRPQVLEQRGNITRIKQVAIDAVFHALFIGARPGKYSRNSLEPSLDG